MSKNKNEILNELYKKYDLGPADTFKSPQGWNIITRNGIDKIQANAGIDITYEVIVCERDFVVVKAKGSMLSDKEVFVETFGEADRSAKGNCRQNYPVAMAEKRAMSRAVLKLSGFYAIEGVYGQDESDDFKKPERQHVPANQFSKAISAVMRGEVTAEDAIQRIESVYDIGESQKHALLNVKVEGDEA